MTESAPNHAPSYLMQFILDILTPLLISGSITDLRLARLAAAEAIDAYKADANSQLITIGQIVAFALTALDNLRLSMPPELSLSMKLKLRGNANALNRSARANTHLLENFCPEVTLSKATAAEPEAMAAPQVPEAAPPDPQPTKTAQPMPPTANQQNSQDWTSILKAQAARLQASAAHLPPDQKKATQLWIDVLNDVAGNLAQPKQTGMNKSKLMRTTLMTSGFALPPHLVNPPKR